MSKRDEALSIYLSHKRGDPGTFKGLFFMGSESDPGLKLLEVSDSVPYVGEVNPFTFRRGEDDKYEVVLILLNRGEWNEVQEGTLKLPDGWDITTADSLDMNDTPSLPSEDRVDPIDNIVALCIDPQVGFSYPSGKLYVKGVSQCLNNWDVLRETSQTSKAALVLEKDTYSIWGNPSAGGLFYAMVSFLEYEWVQTRLRDTSVFKLPRFIVWGVALDFCVLESIKGLRSKYPEASIMIVEDATASVCDVPKSIFEDLGRIEFISTETAVDIMKRNRVRACIMSVDAHDYTCSEFSENGGPFPRHCEQGSLDSVIVPEAMWKNRYVVGKRELVRNPCQVMQDHVIVPLS